MWFEILFMVCAGIVLVKAYAKSGAVSKEEKGYVAVLVLAPVLYMIFYKTRYSVKSMLFGYLFVFLIVCGRYLARITGSRMVYVSYCVKAAWIGLMYAFIIKNYVPAEDGSGMGRDETVLAYAVLSLLLVFSGKIRKWMEKKELYSCFTFFIAATPVLCFFLIEKVHNDLLSNMEWQYVAGNIWWLVLLFIVICYIVPKKRLAIGASLTVALIFGLGNYYVNQFRGIPVMPTDLISTGTAFSVMGEYVYQISGQVMDGVLWWYAAIALLCCFPEKKQISGWKIKAAAGSIAVCICVRFLFSVNIVDTYGLAYDDTVQFFVDNFYKEKGCVLGFTMFLQKLKIEEPEDYSTQKAEEILGEKTGSVMDKTKYPTIIAVMDEAFSDLRVLGEFECSEEYLKNWYAVDDFSCKGNLYVSTFGGRTANTEYEFLTGNSIAGFPAGVIPYQSYELKNVGNLADILKNYGYRTTAVHPEKKGNWGRIRAYSDLGFQTFLGIDDFGEVSRIRNHISDEASFEKVIEVYEAQRGKQFIFNVTMQNHSGYNIEDMEGFKTIRLKEEWSDYTDVETYLTLIRESDMAVKKLIDYFRNIEEPVIICIFGDHLPMVNEDWMEQVRGKPEELLSLEEMQQKYAVPYMIWANYDTPYKQQEMNISANYLGGLLLENTGIPSTAYTNFLLHMREEVPVYNAFGYQTKDGIWHTFEEETEVSEWIGQYRILQYYAMFDAGRNMSYFR